MSASDAAYIRRDADIAHTIPVLAKGALVNSGQSRNAIKRIYVESSKLKEFCDRFVEEVTTFE
jgi:acyl-CoA reductase-like NAD-dependent aldehyde dehydrogenase